MKMNNKKLGNAFERQLSDYLYKNGFWVHLVASDASGQVSDILCLKNGIAYIIDAKFCSKGYFLLDRIENNQESAMQHFYAHGGEEGLFAISFNNDQIYMAKLSTLLKYRDKGIKRIKPLDLIPNSLLIENWITSCK